MILVLIAHSGECYELEASSATKVSKVQTALENLTGVSVEMQILTLEGAKLDSEKTFAFYDISEENFSEGVKIFLYDKSLLLPTSLPPKPEVLPVLKIEFPQATSYEPHQYPFQESSSADLRNLPVYERHFCFHVEKIKAQTEASSEYLRICEKLLAEQEVQALAIDSAQENVDKHYAYIATVYERFQNRFLKQIEDHENILSDFMPEVEKLERTEMHKVFRSSGYKYIIDLVPKDQLCKWHLQCTAMHEQFKPKAEELSALFESVKRDVEALFMTVPSVDIMKLSERLEKNRERLAEMSSICEVLEKDWMSAKECLARGLDSSQDPCQESFLAECMSLHSVAEAHKSDHIPRAEECSKVLERFTKHCIDCKNAMSRCVHSQMKSIAVLQNRISVTRNKLSAYKEVARNLEDAFAHLRVVWAIEEAYKKSLEEVARRSSFAEQFSASAAKFAEGMAAARQKEQQKRQAFEKKNEGLLPLDVLATLKLHLAPPICEIHVSPDEYAELANGSGTIEGAERPEGSGATGA